MRNFIRQLADEINLQFEMTQFTNNNYKSYNHYKSYSPAKSGTEIGGYKVSPVFIQLTIVHGFTIEFCQIYIDIGYKNYKGYKGYSRQSDQMIQAGRSSKQCWAEGFLQKSLEGRLKMIGVTRGSNEELLNDYQDYLRQHKLKIWDKSDPRSLAIRKIAYNNYKSYNDYKVYLKDPEVAANAMIILINQTNQMIDQKYRWEEEKFAKEGGFRERLFKKRMEYKRNEH